MLRRLIAGFRRKGQAPWPPPNVELHLGEVLEIHLHRPTPPEWKKGQIIPCLTPYIDDKTEVTVRRIPEPRKQ
jgi:hypothetical protein